MLGDLVRLATVAPIVRPSPIRGRIRHFGVMSILLLAE